MTKSASGFTAASIQFPKLRLPLLEAAQFTATKWDSADDKAAFGNRFLSFVSKGFPEDPFNQKFYSRLSNTFSHMAHYDKAGFWAEFFAHTTGRIEFLDQTVSHSCFGDPAWTHSDVERVLQRRVHGSGLLAAYRAANAAEIEAAQRATLECLKRRYEPTPSDANDAPLATRQAGPAVQLGLF